MEPTENQAALDSLTTQVTTFIGDLVPVVATIGGAALGVTAAVLGFRLVKRMFKGGAS